ncbi:hypothetical protein PSJE_28020 [Pseudomonas jessenii]|nr:hypothetical protein PSJE_28020 [Pseudomonas jessenii]
MSGEKRGCTPLCLCSSVGASLLAKAASQSTEILRMYSVPVGASLLAKNVQTPRSFRQQALSLTSFASKLAPTGDRIRRNGYVRLQKLTEAPRRYPR